MKIKIASEADPKDLPIDHIDVAVVGDPVDERGTAATTFCRHLAHTAIKVEYVHDELVVKLDSLTIGIDEVETELENRMSGRSVLLEATTLGVAELALAIGAARSSATCIEILYVEPHQYRKVPSSGVIHSRDFELTDSAEEFSAIPSTVTLISDESRAVAVMLLGFEGERLTKAMEASPVLPRRTHVVFGVPAFDPGWEIDSFKNNLSVICEEEIEQIDFAAANDPSATYAVLRSIYSTYSGDSLAQREFVVVPIGTKPAGIGAILFAVDNPEVGLMYDFPRRRTGRSVKTRAWHQYSLNFNE